MKLVSRFCRIPILSFSFHLFYFLLWFFAFCQHAPASEQYGLWRFWTEKDGLVESYIRNISLTPENHLWMRHGDVDRLSFFDGYSIQTLPYPQDIGQIKTSHTGQTWTLNLEGFHEWIDGKWVLHPLKTAAAEHETLNTILSFHPIAENELVYLYVDKVKRYSAAAREEITIQSAREGAIGRYIDLIGMRNNSAWILGESGVAHYIYDKKAPKQEEWEEYPFPSTQWRQPHGALLGKSGELLFVVENTKSNQFALIQFDGTDWTALYEGENIRYGWTDFEDRVWIDDGFSFYVIDQGRKNEIVRQEVLLGRIIDITIEPGGSFWLATNQGLARFSPNLFNTLSSSLKYPNKIHSIMQSRDGSLWFAGGNNLLCFDQASWTMNPLPNDLETNYYHTQALAELPDKRIIFETRDIFTDQETGSHFYAYQPSQKTFETISHPQNREIRLIADMTGAGAFVVSGSYKDYQIDWFDGTDFQLVLDRGERWEIGAARYPFFSSQGDLWIGGTQGIARYR
ncbi:hypothetical protein GF373_02565, partial [bacterium]|nr:hypothetical protein [bacterium]